MCDVRNYQIYTNVAKFLDWIKSEVKKTSNELSPDDPSPTQLSKVNRQCGRISLNVGLVVGGRETKRGEWPFLAALFLRQTVQFFCAGNLVTTQHVLTGKMSSKQIESS